MCGMTRTRDDDNRLVRLSDALLDLAATQPPMTHAPNCERPGVALERGHSITVTRCLGCGAITTERNRT